jgi:hypothetical protein
MYDVVSAIDLWVFDTLEGKWQKPLRIADSWGDAGELFDIQSWIGDIDNDGMPDIVCRTLRTYWDTIIERKNSVFIWKKDQFRDESRKYLSKIDLARYRFVNRDIQ